MAFLKSGWRSAIASYERALSASAGPANRDQLKRCHVAKLVLFDDPEVRLRSIQTLAELGAPERLCPALLDLQCVSKRWPSPKSTGLATLLLKSLMADSVQIGSGGAEQTNAP